MIRLLGSIGIEVSVERHGSEERLKCIVPPHRHDLTREIDLIEELGRLNGFDKIKVAPTLDVHLELSHPQDWARREKAMERLSAVLTGAGFFETVTFSFLTKEHASMFLPSGLRLLMVDEQRRPGSPYLRPSAVPSLLTCRRANQDGQVRGEGSLGVRLFECASTFAEQDDGNAFARKTVERRVLSLLIDAPLGTSQSSAAQESLRQLRGVIESAARTLGGAGVRVDVESMSQSSVPALEGETQATVRINGVSCGFISTISGATLRAWGLERPLAAAEIDLQTLIELYPPRATAHALPRFPSIERDLSVVVDEAVAWSRFEGTIMGLRPPLMEELEFVTVYRGKPVPTGKKSVTLRMTFRDPDRTLRHEEVDPQIASVVAALGKDVGGELRT